MKITFNGAAGIVTGSCYLLETENKKILIDCGMFQGTKEITRLNYEPFPFNPKEISYVLLTHAHVDHCGLIPKLVKNGFTGKIISTGPTLDLTQLMLKDAAHVNEDETLQENKRRVRAGLEPRDPLYTLEDAVKSFSFFSPVNYENPRKLSNDLEVIFHNAGHILGSSMVEIHVSESGKITKFLFSGDVGQGGTPILDDPTVIENADYVIVESTYGNRSHGNLSMRKQDLLKVVKETYARGGKLMIPSFAVERTQELLYYLHLLIRDGSFPNQKIFLDSPLAIEVTKVFKKNLKYFSKNLTKEFSDPFTFNQLKCLKTQQESRDLNDYAAPCIIIAGSGMCNAGRIRHHIKHNIWNPKNTLLFVGYQAEGTLGRIILEGAKSIWMMGSIFAVKSQIRKIDSFSSHATADQLIKWISKLKNKPNKIFVTHGEKISAEALSLELRKFGFKSFVPKIGDTINI
ncbi:MAG: MBL fold metallo-hydrolase [Candidatus Micrarchaeota archaeon]